MPLVRVPDGHALKKCLQTRASGEVHLVLREADERELVLKAYRSVEHESEPRVSREFEVLRRLAGPGIPAALAVLPACGDAEATLVLERVPGITLRLWAESTRVGPAALLEVAVQLADVLTRVHVARLIHRGISGTHVIVDPMTLQTHLLDFGLARPLGAALHSGTAPGGPTGPRSLAYISPEQTGRMDRGVDPRSDLYSLGACLYHALTGRPPFVEPDALALTHAHFAKLPVPPIQLRPEIPSTLSRIVLKLLQKSPEDRYQTADALHVDLLECRRQLQEHGCIANDMPLATADVPYRPLFSTKLYGRDREIQEVLSAYARAASGVPTILLIRGAPGAGKSALAQTLRTAVGQGNGYLVQGKFDAYRREKPYAAFAQALTALADQLLTQSDTALAQWREQLRSGVGAIAGALLELAPNLGLVLGDIPAVPALGHGETRARLILAVQRLVQTVASREHPLVLLLDDLQWADEASRTLLRELALQTPDSSVLLVGVYRDNEVDAHHPLGRVLGELTDRGLVREHIALGPLDLEACAQMLATALGRPVEQTRSLASCVGRKTGSAPLLIQQFVHHMYDLGLIHYEAGSGWIWDDAQLAAADISDDAVALMTAKISRLEAGVLHALQLASCASDVFDLETLIELSESSGSQLERALFQLCDEGLLDPAPAGFRFAHDRIREAAVGLLSDEQRTRLHYQAGLLLLERVPAESLSERALEIADHLNRGAAVLEAKTVPRAIEINILAGKQALNSGASATAAPYFASARRLHGRLEGDAATPGFDLLLCSAEAAYQMRDFALARELLDRLEEQPLVPMQAGVIAAKRIAVEQLERSGADVMPLVIATLRRFGVRWPSMPSHLRTRMTLAWTDWMLRRPLRPALPGAFPRWAPILLTIAASGGALTMKSVRHTALGAGLALRIYVRNGYMVAPALVIAGYGSFRLGYLRHLRGAERYAQVALDWTERAPHISFDSRARYIVHAFIHAWTRPRRSVLEPLREVFETLLEIGDIEYAYYAALQRVGYMALCGEPLHVIQHEYESMGARMQRTVHVQIRALQSLQDAACDSAQLLDDVRALQLTSDSPSDEAMKAWAFWLGVLCILGHHGEAAAVAESIRARVRDVGSTVSQLADHAFFGGISAVAAAGEGGGDRVRKARRLLRGYLRQLRVWAREGPDFRHMVIALQAEGARLDGKDRVALAQYAQAATAAAQAGYRHHAALLHERRAQLLQRLGRKNESNATLALSLALYREWGAHSKVAQLCADSAAADAPLERRAHGSATSSRSVLGV